MYNALKSSLAPVFKRPILKRGLSLFLFPLQETSAVSERTGKVQTVRGLIEAKHLGATLMHEHLLGDYTPPNRRPEPALPITMQNRWQMDYEWVIAKGNVNLTNL